MNLAGCMEYDRTLRDLGNYREFLFTKARYREVVPLDGVPKCEEIRSSCTLLFRLRYTRDIMLHPKIDDPGVTAIGSMISFTSAELCSAVRNHPWWLLILYFLKSFPLFAMFRTFDVEIHFNYCTRRTLARFSDIADFSLTDFHSLSLTYLTHSQ
jgi:hypothetical protein